MAVTQLGIFGIESLDFTRVRIMFIKPYIEDDEEDIIIKHVVSMDDI